MESLLIISLIFSFLVTLFFTPLWIKKAKNIGLIWEDMNKKGHPKNVSGSGGIIVLFGFLFGVLLYIALKTFILKTDIYTTQIFALLMTVFLAGFIGFVDDIFGWVKGGLSARFRILLLIFAAIPLMVINAGESSMIGIEFGLWYPLILIPLGVVGASSTFNFIAGYNGIETSQGIILLGALSFVNYIAGNSWLALIGLVMIFCLLAFYVFNKYPAKIFPGDVLTYSVGALIACMAILGNVEKIAVFFFIPYILETGLKLRGKLRKQSFGKVQEDGTLDVPYEKFYGLEHIAIYVLKKIKKSGKVYEKEVVYIVNLFQIIIILVGLMLFGGIYAG